MGENVTDEGGCGRGWRLTSGNDANDENGAPATGEIAMVSSSLVDQSAVVPRSWVDHGVVFHQKCIIGVDNAT